MKVVKEKLYEGLKDELIQEIIGIVYKDLSGKDYYEKLQYLQSLSEDDLDEILSDYHTFGIK